MSERAGMVASLWAKQNNINGKRLAQSLGVAPSRISEFFNGKRPTMDIQFIDKLAKATQTDFNMWVRIAKDELDGIDKDPKAYLDGSDISFSNQDPTWLAGTALARMLRVGTGPIQFDDEDDLPEINADGLILKISSWDMLSSDQSPAISHKRTAKLQPGQVCRLNTAPYFLLDASARLKVALLDPIASSGGTVRFSENFLPQRDGFYVTAHMTNETPHPISLAKDMPIFFIRVWAFETTHESVMGKATFET